jgi:hypothetical protein
MLRLLLCLSLLPLKALACTEPGTGFLPDNHKKIPVSVINTGLTEAEYNAVIDKVANVYSPIVRRYGGVLQVERLWQSDTVNAGTLRRNDGKTWVLNLYGGFARHPDITPDGYMLVICHEIGHHIGGAPKKVYDSGISWSSTEGQADYFATLKCLRRVLRKDDNITLMQDVSVPEGIRTECQRSFPVATDAALCMRTAIAGMSVARVNAAIREIPAPDIDVTDSTIVAGTINDHPVPQCRLNTYYQGSLCPVSYVLSVSQTDEVKGTCHQSLDYKIGLRPSCWYKSK